MLRSREGLSVDTTTIIRTGERHQTDTPYGQRSSIEVNQDPDVPSQNPAYRTSVPLYQGTGGPRDHPDNWNQGQKQSSGPSNETTTNELDWTMEDGNLHWLDTFQWD